jgi:hypothetical protein
MSLWLRHAGQETAECVLLGVHSPDLAQPLAKKLAKKHADAEKSGTAMVLSADDPIAKKAFADQS